jgi:hypothetical protein
MYTNKCKIFKNDIESYRPEGKTFFEYPLQWIKDHLARLSAQG